MTTLTSEGVFSSGIGFVLTVDLLLMETPWSTYTDYASIKPSGPWILERFSNSSTKLHPAAGIASKCKSTVVEHLIVSETEKDQ